MEEREYNGAVVCFQKFTIGQNAGFQNAGSSNMKIPGSPACLGYFNRVDVKTIRDFRKYVSVTSKHEAEFPCSRKQLLLRRIKKLKGREEVTLINSEEAGNSLPFEGKNKKSYALCCFSVFSVGEDKSMRKNSGGSESFYTELAEELYDILDRSRKKNEYDCQIAFMELLGAEDLCLIVLSNQYQAISGSIEKLQSFNFESSARRKEYCNCRVDNVHSILMMDRNARETLELVDWNNAEAEMHFSLHSAPGMRYLRDQEKLLRELLEKTERRQDKPRSEQNPQSQILVQSCSGEYDAILRCPAWMLPIVLGLPGPELVQGCFHPDNVKYQSKVYQSDTYIYPFGLNNCDVDDDASDEDEDVARAPCADRSKGVRRDTPLVLPKEVTELQGFVKQAMESLRGMFEVEGDDNSFDFQELPIWRLLKEFWSFASFPLREDLREDLEYQFKVAINAIVREADLSRENYNRATFMEKYQQIVKALDDSMQAASQQDRWYFGEQQSYIENVESYYKILRCYYGMLKDMITLIYQIPRTPNTNQPYLIPMLSFGVNPLIQSNAYESYIDHHVDQDMEEDEAKRDAKLISIKLPYQALSNPLKYLGILAHEIFHYAAPADRANRNELMCCALIRVAISEFIDILAKNCGIEEDKDVWMLLADGDKTFREIIDIAVINTFDNIKKKHPADQLLLRHIREMVWEGELRFTVDSTAKQGYDCYYKMWANIRSLLLRVMETDPAKKHPELRDLAPLCAEYVPYYTRMFALDEEVPEDQDLRVKDSVLRELYERQIQKTAHYQTKEARNLLRTMFKAMVECPPDIFDLEVVMHGKTEDEKIRQFFWQQHSAKRDLLTPRAIYRGDDNKPLLKNDIRSAMVVGYYLRKRYNQDDPVMLEAVLQKWGACDFKPFFENTRKEFVRCYELVYKRFRYILQENDEICGLLSERIAHQVDVYKLKERLTSFYQSHYDVLTEYQSSAGTAEDENIRYDATFEKTCALIDTYQDRGRFRVKGPTSGPPLPENDGDEEPTDSQETENTQEAVRDPRFVCDLIAYNNADFMHKLSLAYEKMMVNKRIPMLWYRGQREWEWRTLPNIMRISRMTTDMPDHEGFAKTMFYGMQLARAHILPNGEHLSDAEWIAFMQHYEFKTNALDFSESLAPALYFATEKWADDKEKRPEHDAVVMAFNPILFNLVMELFEQEELLQNFDTAEAVVNEYDHNLDVLRQLRSDAKQKLMSAKKAQQSVEQIRALEDMYDRFHVALRVLTRVGVKNDVKPDLSLEKMFVSEAVARAKQNLKQYYETGINFEQPPLFAGTTELMDTRYRYLYDPMLSDEFDSCYHPRAVMVPRHCDRMDKQSGEFVYFNLAAEKAPRDSITEKDGLKRVYDYDRWSLEALHTKYVERCRRELMDYEKVHGKYPDAKFIPFLCRIKINRYRHNGFKRYVHAMGMHRFSVYPEYDKLAEDLIDQLELK